MIGVVAHARDLDAAHEFFELFKTPWEPAVPDRRYRVLLVGAGADRSRYQADLVLVYGAEAGDSDRRLGAEAVHGPAAVEWGNTTFPIYGDLLAFAGVSPGGAACAGRAIDAETHWAGQTVRRIGYDLFGEVRRLLTDGQPAARATVPTLELHVAFVRSILTGAGIPFVEVPPRPHGYDFTCCLTHDLDFFGIRRHGLDRTMLGFLYRSTIGTVLDLLRGRRSAADAWANWTAFLKLPLMFAGLLSDPWRPFHDYAATERPDQSTFFVVPFKDHAGTRPGGGTEPARAVRYALRDVADEVRAAAESGSEIALHGLDAWRDSASGAREGAEMRAVTGRRPAGVRMHWLYFDQDSPSRLEAAGFAYDSTWGYNDAVGYRAGTSQVFRPFGSDRLLELPLSLMDSALLFPNRMNLAPDDALRQASTIVGNAARFGGTLVVNWHDRSLAPERLWGGVYRALLSDIRDSGRVWFANAGQAVEWYRWRRAIRFVRNGDSTTVVAPGDRERSLPAAVLTMHCASGDGATREARIDAGTLMTLTFSSAPSADSTWRSKAI